MAVIEKRTLASGAIRWRARVRIKGHPVKVGTFLNKTLAVEWARKQESSIKEGLAFPERRKVKRWTFAELVARYLADVTPLKSKLTQYNQDLFIRRWNDAIGPMFLRDITPSKIVEVRDNLAKEHGQIPASVNVSMAAVRHMFKLAVREWGMLEVDPTMNVKPMKTPPPKTPYLTQEQAAHLLDVCREMDDLLHDMVLFLLATGCRREECRGLRWGDVNLTDRTVTFTKTKNGKVRHVPLIPDLVAMLEARGHIRRLDNDLVFCRVGNDAALHIGQRFPRAVERAGLAPFRLHDLRHSAASFMVQGGIPLYTVGAILGHSKTSTTQRYSHLDLAATREGVGAIQAALTGGSRT